MIDEHRCEVTIYAFCTSPAVTVALIQLQRSFALMDQKLAQLSVLNQKDKGTTYLSLLSSIFSSQGNPNIANDVHALVDHLINQDAGIIASRQVLSELIKGLTSTNISDKELLKAVVEDVLSVVQLRATSYEEQVRAIKPQAASGY
jgi:COP9 signalosome complex subunit 4